MGWLLLWCGIGLLWLVVLASCGWLLWRRGRALYDELARQGRTLSELAQLWDQAAAGRATVSREQPEARHRGA